MTVTICGSMRFIPEMLEWYGILSLEGYLVYLPVFLGTHSHTMLGRDIRSLVDETVIKVPHYLSFTDELKEKLQQLHFKKISESDFIFVVNPGGYIGEGTRAEIEYAKDHLTLVQYLDKPSWDIDDDPLERLWRDLND